MNDEQKELKIIDLVRKIDSIRLKNISMEGKQREISEVESEIQKLKSNVNRSINGVSNI